MLGTFTYADIAIAVIALICIIVGYKKGFVKQLFSLLKFAGSIVTAIFTYAYLGGLFNTWFGGAFAGWLSFVPDPTATALIVCNVLAFLLILIVASIIISAIGNWLTKASKSKIFGDLNKVIGMVYSVALLYVIILALGFGIDFAAQTENIMSIGFVATVVSWLNQQFDGGTIIRVLTENNWLSTIIVGLMG